jgi:hypothetical protein
VNPPLVCQVEGLKKKEEFFKTNIGVFASVVDSVKKQNQIHSINKKG